ncbi:hypothetical protein M438DRAFT_121240 [Aureobasidium pullulans EXF-150]|uniref:Uncharacterized protein n=1 Tax=Aureobasidium pullulans EXF-150 TaxID=1043002 RepID=A0A074XDB6_AURPU|nr:uncharacterized protein M438DRAFT_121240 [Aureobasidium pullulans EXF-150]KEQ80027.1 hypothetical protein M438DRAFT_121240 [Aureobasidium pullulans EXF-150]
MLSEDDSEKQWRAESEVLLAEYERTTSHLYNDPLQHLPQGTSRSLDAYEFVPLYRTPSHRTPLESTRLRNKPVAITPSHTRQSSEVGLEQAHPGSSSIDRILSADTPNEPSSSRSLGNRKASAPTSPKVAHSVSTASNADLLPSKNDAEYPNSAQDAQHLLSGSGNSFSNQLDAMHRDLGNSLDDIRHSIDDLRHTIMEFRADITGFSQSSKSAAEYNGYYGKRDEVEEEEVYEWEKDDCMDKFA